MFFFCVCGLQILRATGLVRLAFFLLVLLVVMESSGSSSVGSYSDGVYEKAESQSKAAAATNKPLPQVKPPVLPAVMLACLILLFTTCFVGILLSGLHFGHRVESGDCLGQSWVMFSVRTLPAACHFLHSTPLQPSLFKRQIK